MRTLLSLSLRAIAGLGLTFAITTSCSDDAPTTIECPEGQLLCGALCVNPNTSASNCGASDTCEGALSGSACESGFVCNGAGSCELSCQDGLVQCDGVCTNPDTDNAYCGATTCSDDATNGEVCSSGSACLDGSCTLSCQAGQIDCAGQCTDPMVSAQYCGATTCADDATDGEFCADGYSCESGSCMLTCQTGQVDCYGQCVNPSSDNQYCGATTCADDATDGETCADGSVCNGAGVCAPTCEAGLSECNGGCVDTQNNPNFCGSCINSCPSATSAAGICVAGTCDLSCDLGTEDCNRMDGDGCEVTLVDDANNCGACNNVCASGVCQSGACLLPKVVFVTSTLHNGNLGGLAGADAICQARANEAGLTGTFMAWLSDSSGSPATRFTQSTLEYVLVDGTVIANSYADLTDGVLTSAPNLTELGGSVPVGTNGCPGTTVWTNTNANGTLGNAGSSCSDWSITAGASRWGAPDNTDSDWTSWCSGGDCSWTSPLYCVAQ